MTAFVYVDGCRGYIFQGVFFTEGFPETATSLETVETTSNVQNTNLDWLREKLATQVKGLGGNALTGFRYVQKANIFSFSSVSWNASGTASVIANLEDYRDASASSGETINKMCSYCGEQILAVAKKCKHCGEFLK